MQYKQSYSNLSKNKKQFNEVVGLDLEIFDDLIVSFEKEMDAYDKEFTISGVRRTHSPGIRKDNNFSCQKDKLCFILSYLKNNALQQTHASNWSMLQPRANIWIHLLLERLLSTLQTLSLVPATDSVTLSALLIKAKTIFLDGTERSIQRPLHKEEQKRHYSGKKTHTVKHNIICDEHKQILYLSKAYNGTTHDKKLADEENLKFPETNIVHLFQDTGYQGYKPENTIIIQLTKKPKGKELSEEQKQANKKISSKRVVVEHAISGVKILRMIKDEIRIYKGYTRNIVMKIACAIHNLKIKITQIVKKC